MSRVQDLASIVAGVLDITGQIAAVLRDQERRIAALEAVGREAKQAAEFCPNGDGWVSFVPNADRIWPRGLRAETEVEVRLRDGGVYTDKAASFFWGETDTGTIVAYRLPKACPNDDCDNQSQCFEPCGALGHDEKYAVRSDVTEYVVRWRGPASAGRYRDFFCLARDAEEAREICERTYGGCEILSARPERPAHTKGAS